MKKLILGTLMVAAISAGAEEQQASTTTATATAPAAGTTSMTATESAPLFQLNLSSESYVGMRDQNTLHAGAPVTSVNAVGLIYTGLPSKMKFELRQYMEYLSNKENSTDDAALALHENAWEISYTVLRLAGSLESLGAAIGSKPIAIEGRYYAPTDRVAQAANKNGILRMDMIADWNLTPAWEVLGVVSPRISLNSERNTDAAVGSDAQYYRMVAGAYGCYNFNDKLQAYYGFSQDVRSRDAQRGTWAADQGNTAIHEIGLNWTVGPVTINPVFESDLVQTDGTASIFTADSRYFADDTTSANINLYATF